MTAPSGWTLVRSTTSGSALTQATYVHAAGDVGTLLLPVAVLVLPLASGAVAAYVGVNTTTPVDVSAGGSSSDSTRIVAPSVTTTIAGDLLIGVFGEADKRIGDAADRDARAGRAAGRNRQHPGRHRDLADQPLGGAGATGTRTATLSKSGANVGQLIALRPSQ